MAVLGEKWGEFPSVPPDPRLFFMGGTEKPLQINTCPPCPPCPPSCLLGLGIKKKRNNQLIIGD